MIVTNFYLNLSIHLLSELTRTKISFWLLKNFQNTFILKHKNILTKEYKKITVCSCPLIKIHLMVNHELFIYFFCLRIVNSAHFQSVVTKSVLLCFTFLKFVNIWSNWPELGRHCILIAGVVVQWLRLQDAKSKVQIPTELYVDVSHI